MHGDALTLQTVSAEGGEPITFSEWSAVNGSMLKRRDFKFSHLIDRADSQALPLFSDLGDESYIPEPIADHPLIHFLEVAAHG